MMENDKELAEALQKIEDSKIREFFKTRIQYLEQKSAKYEKESRTDHLTGVLNRRGFEERLERTISRAQRHGIAFSYGFADLYNLKGYNQVDYQIGSEAIITLANILEENARIEDTVARTGGDEFSLLVSGLKEEHHEDYLQRMKKIISNTPKIIEEIPFIVYWGLAEYKGQSIEELVYEADRKLILEKEKIKKLS